MRILDISQVAGWLNEVIAWVKFTSMHQYQRFPTDGRKNAQVVLSKITTQGNVEDLYEYLTYIYLHPFIKDIFNELTVLHWSDRTNGDQICSWI